MYKLIIISLLIISFTGNIVAQKNNEKIIDKKLEKVQEKLKIDNIQLLIIKEVVLKYNNQKTALHQQEIPDQEKRIQIKELNLKQEKELQAFLDKEQLVEFNKIMKEQKKERKKSRPSKGSGNRRGKRNSF
ncbi:hypothetical protein PG913_07670 [Tenacibaculum pacificus]|uniref:hypothetical protein n=1 Tax=Tenacibaculum pacificus TaxID=3018314 RepID=UPI0022F3CBB5|nr:hypothetical protein [Tenacibaculum pacificus]WBX72787.1 hypothetical protein PG913_07670 [Tenacibaculum pacificus]